jgi:hypothetical protein
MSRGGDDDVADLGAGALGRAVVFRLERLDLGAADRRETRGLCIIRVDLTDRDAEDGALHLAVLDQIVHDLLRQRDRNREAVAGVVAGSAGDRAVDADHVTADVEERTARVTWVDGASVWM